MKLKTISEVRLKGKMVIRNTALVLGDLIKFTYDHGEDSAKTALNDFLKAPSPKGWEKTEWIVDSAIKQAVNNPEFTIRAEKWGQLKDLTPPVLTSAIYDIDPRMVKGTPLASLTFGSSIRDRYKLALGPQGYVGTMSNVGRISNNKLKEMLRITAQNGVATSKAIKHDVSGIKQQAKF